MPGAVGTESEAARLVAVETGWLWWGSGAQAWRMECELRGSPGRGPGARGGVLWVQNGSLEALAMPLGP